MVNKVWQQPKPAIVQVYSDDAGETAYRCPACESLNIDKDQPKYCPDCGTKIVYPDIMLDDEVVLCNCDQRRSVHAELRVR